MTTLYHTLTPAAQRAFDTYDEARYIFESSREEEHRVAMESAREALLRALRSEFVRATMANDEAA